MQVQDFALAIEGLKDITFPRFVKIRQRFNRIKVGNIPDQVHREFSKTPVATGIPHGCRVAVAVGSRGIANIQEIVRAVVGELKKLGAIPVIVPAMGSHGGGTAEGQREVLAGYGITPDEVGASIHSSQDVVQVGEINGQPVYYDHFAFHSDAVVLINRVKPHTDFKGPIESGLIKMMVIGLGNHAGASSIHRQGFENFRQLIPKVGEIILAHTPPTIGVAVLENAYEETAIIEAVPGADIWKREPELLKTAKQLMPRLPLDAIDVLIVNEMGKDISGAGMDNNIIGRVEGFDEVPSIGKIMVLDLTERTHGNACGMGYIDVTTTKMISKIDFKVTFTNDIASGSMEKIPPFLNSEKEALQVALITSRVRPEKSKIIRIKNTLELSEMIVSEPCLPGLTGENMEILGAPFSLAFDEKDNLL
ncbi:hypothetical protein [Candidatus Formimonas warabiya]|uniref:DUF2088 domain-containing protein n=1 Tax=Formimonas warabiya TaxID=1761012 RepID=A0A3G1L051_FORW1|nr:hypothetical protein [Candidatus Formimonas warabiya]ATW28153.1 hypothetical protein DCMF_28400 [Candidatus Formimonas warabiya]